MFFNKKTGEFRDDPKEVREESRLPKKGTIFQNNQGVPKTLKQLVDQSEDVLLTIKAIYPLDLNPDAVTIDKNKVNIIRKELFGMENIHSILIEDITNVTVGRGFFTATLDIIDSTNYRFPQTYTVRHLNVKNALLARRLIQGLIAAKREGVDLSGITGDDVVDQLENLGRARGEHDNN